MQHDFDLDNTWALRENLQRQCYYHCMFRSKQRKEKGIAIFRTRLLFIEVEIKKIDNSLIKYLKLMPTKPNYVVSKYFSLHWTKTNVSFCDDIEFNETNGAKKKKV